MKTIRIGFLGLGTVGSGALAALTAEREAIARRVGAELLPVRAAVRDTERHRAVDTTDLELTTDTMAVATADDIDVVVEVIGGVGIAREAVIAALSAGKSVVTANKELIAKHGLELFALADKHHVDLAFEGSVGGGIPIIQPLGSGLTANRVKQVVGIINGTTNYILSAMTRSGQAFDDLLAEAQAKGYAESDPSADIDGHDAAYKLTILAMLAFDTAVSEEQVCREGISSITPADITLARNLGYRFKLLAVAKDRGEKLELRVSPCLVPETHPLANVNDVFNAIFVEAAPVGQVMFYGRGAGADPTGSAVAGDIITVARNLGRGGQRSYPLGFSGHRTVATVDEIESSYYVRMRVADRVGVLAELAGILGSHGVSIAQVLQTRITDDLTAGLAELVWITHDTTEANIRASLATMDGLDEVVDICNVFRCFGVDA
ncbi:MAG: homoserine dehydrogenase [Armatimonadetes bacterium]|nr:homoserine dehydrogenase [Armatimonadota bacterium]